VNHARKTGVLSPTRRIAGVILFCAWQAFRLPVLGLMTILAPLVRLVLTGFALVMTLTAFLFEFTTSARDFPFFGMLALGLAALAVLALYESLLGLLSGRTE
jgi:hypothetical protein